MLKEQSTTLVGIARGADLGLIGASFAAGAVVCERLKGVEALPWLAVSRGPQNIRVSDEYALLLFTSLIGWIAVTQWRGTYSIHRTERFWSILRQDIVTQILWVLLTGFSVFLFKLDVISRAFCAIFLPLSIILLNLRQTSAHILLRSIRARGFNLRSVALLGDAEGVARLSSLIERETTTGYRVVDYRNNDDGTPSHLFNPDIDEVFFILGNGSSERDRLILELVKKGKRVHLVPGIFDATLFRQNLNDLGGIPVLSLGGYGLSGLETAAKRFLDVFGSIVLLVLFVPVMALIALMVKLSAPGPVLFRQERLGEGGRRFRIYKFRTMFRDAEKALRSDPALYRKYVENNYKLPKGEDPRITPLGDFLRSTSLDELPQLFNVIKGDMSLVGPRPIVPPEIDKYGEYGLLFKCVKPGLTGNWQIHGRSEVVDYSRRAALDIEYIRDQSFSTDVDILLKTIPAVLLRKGAH